MLGSEVVLVAEIVKAQRHLEWEDYRANRRRKLERSVDIVHGRYAVDETDRGKLMDSGNDGQRLSMEREGQSDPRTMTIHMSVGSDLSISR